MNDYQMIQLAAQRGHDFQAEAQRHRLASETKRERSGRPAQRRRSRTFGIGFLLRRAAV